ncbi:MAG: sialate O-acetylesterase [Fuerstiella sp.]|jgi:sialate O-acetylesterase|nr:sialate O-acetylesterase [Fuerstiella sp.]
MFNHSVFQVLTALLLAGSPSICHAQLTVADIFSDHMVLQQGQKVPVWGTGIEGQNIHVQFGNQSHIATIGKNGRWLVKLQPLKASAEPQQLSIQSEVQIIFKDVLVGEVWLASGQSNMGFTMKASAKNHDATQAILDTSNYPLIRYRAVKTKENDNRQSHIGDDNPWTKCTTQTAANYSAVAFLFARRLHSELDVPIGIIENAWGGHPIEPFIPAEAFKSHPVLIKELELGRRKDIDGIRRMVGGVRARDNSWLPGTIFNSRIAPIAPYAIKGAIWYQAESNCGKGEDPRFYSEKMKALVRGWRQAWNIPSLPVYYVQLPQYPAPGWVMMRDEQRRAMNEPHTGMAVTIDLALDQIHPANKIDVANRLVRWPLFSEYGKHRAVCGPMFKAFHVNGQHIRVEFDYVNKGLATGQKEDLEPTRLIPSQTVHGFEVADASGQWYTARAQIEGRTVLCDSDQVQHPVAVRYGWAPVIPKNEPWNLYNEAGLPASPFISDPQLMTYEPQAISP